MKLNDGTPLYDYSRPYFVAEFNTSHFGDVALAKEMIEECSRIGVDCVKFQSWSADTLYSQSYYAENKMAKRFVKKYSLSEDQLLELAGYCKTRGIGFMSTPYSMGEARFLVDECGVPALKVASMEINNLDYLSALAQLGSAMILSTGMADLDEIETAVRVVQDAGCKDLTVLHCVSRYPIENQDANLRNVALLKEHLPDVAVGYSDHTLGLEAPVAAVALGASVIERHFTLDRSRIGMDNQMATEPKEFAEMIKRCTATWQCMGEAARKISEEELRQRENMRRSLVYARDCEPGAVISKEDLICKRPGTGFPPTAMEQIVGKTLTRAVEGDFLVQAEDFQ